MPFSKEWQKYHITKAVSFSRQGSKLKRQPGLFQEIQKFRRGFRFRPSTELPEFYPQPGPPVKTASLSSDNKQSIKASKGGIQRFVELDLLKSRNLKGLNLKTNLWLKYKKFQTKCLLLKKSLLKDLDYELDKTQKLLGKNNRNRVKGSLKAGLVVKKSLLKELRSAINSYGVLKQREVLNLNKKLTLAATQKQKQDPLGKGVLQQQPSLFLCLISGPLRVKIQTNIKLLLKILKFKGLKKRHSKAQNKKTVKIKTPESSKQKNLCFVKQKPYMASPSLIKYLKGRETFKASPILKPASLQNTPPATQGLALGVQQSAVAGTSLVKLNKVSTHQTFSKIPKATKQMLVGAKKKYPLNSFFSSLLWKRTFFLPQKQNLLTRKEEKDIKNKLYLGTPMKLSLARFISSKLLKGYYRNLSTKAFKKSLTSIKKSKKVMASAFVNSNQTE